jgi:hypothetical protein
MDFDRFINSIEYIEQVIKRSIGIDPVQFSTNETVKNNMRNNNKDYIGSYYWLPSNNKEQLNSIKNVLLEKNGFEECLSVYTDLKRLSDSFNI